MATRVYHSDSGGSNTSTSSAVTYTDHRTLTFTPDPAGGTYVIIGYAESQVNNDNTVDTQVELWDDTAAAQLMQSVVEMPNTGGTVWAPVNLMAVVTFGASAPSQTYKIRHKLEAATGGRTSDARNGSLVALKLGAADVSMSNDGFNTSTANPGAWTDYNPGSGTIALTFTPGTSGDYLVIGMGRISADTAGGISTRLLAEDGSTASGPGRHAPADTGTRSTIIHAIQRTLAASSHTFKLQFARATTGTGTQAVGFARMVALRLSDFNGATATEDTGADATTSATYVDLGDTRTDTLLNGVDYLLIASSDSENGSTGVDTFVTLTDGTNTYAEAVHRETVAARGRTFLVPKVITGTGASVTHKFQGHTNGTATLTLDEHRLYVLQLEEGNATASPATVAAVLSQPAVTTSAGSTVSPATAALVATQPAVTAGASATTSPATAAVVLAQPAVQARAGSTVSPATAAVVLAQPAVQARAGSTTSPATAALTLTQPAVTTSAGATVSPATAALILAQPPVTATGGGSATASPAAAALTLTQPAVQARAGSTVAPAVTALILAQPAVQARAGSTSSPATAAAVLAQPAVTATGSALTAPSTVGLVLTQPAVTATGGATASPDTVTITVVYPPVTATSDSAGAVTVHEYTTVAPVYAAAPARPVYSADQADNVMACTAVRSIAA